MIDNVIIVSCCVAITIEEDEKEITNGIVENGTSGEVGNGMVVVGEVGGGEVVVGAGEEIGVAKKEEEEADEEDEEDMGTGRFLNI